MEKRTGNRLHEIAPVSVNSGRERILPMPSAVHTLTAPMNEATERVTAATAHEKDQFVEQHLRRIYAQIYRMVGNVDDAQDLTQEVFIKALQRSEQIRDSQKAAHWLSRVATNTAIDFMRRHGRANFTPVDELVEPLTSSPHESPERQAIRTEQRAKLEAGMRRLSGRERAALILRDVEDLPAEEVARQLNCSKATVRSHIANARVKFRQYLERKGI